MQPEMHSNNNNNGAINAYKHSLFNFSKLKDQKIFPKQHMHFLSAESFVQWNGPFFIIDNHPFQCVLDE